MGKYTMLELLMKLSELRDENDLISLDQLAELALDEKLPEDEFKKLLPHLIEHRNDFNRRKELMSELPLLTNELDALMIQLKESSEPLALMDEILVFQNKFETITSEIEELNKRISDRATP